MDITTIGKTIAELRKTKGAKQDELAKYVGVSPQAVSKWENGGVPDTELLPRIADFFEVSIDALFDRPYSKFASMQDMICADIVDKDEKDRIFRGFELCWMLQQALFGKVFSDEARFREEAGEFDCDDQLYSRILADTGYTQMGLFNRLQYFLLVPDAPDKNKALLDGIDYPRFFALMADRDLFDTLVFLYKRESLNSFTEKLLVKELSLTPEKAKQIIATLHSLQLLAKSNADIDDELVELYQFRAKPSFVSMLIFAREMIDVPSNFYVNYDARRTPYLK